MSTQREDWTAADQPAAPDPSVGPASETAVPLLNIANILTILRILLVPVFLVVLFVGDGHSRRGA